MITLIRREFFVDVPLETAWQHLARVTEWPSWAKHIKRVELIPAGELSSQSRGNIHLRNGVKSSFKMADFNLHQNWKWVGAFLWLTIHYDHRFEAMRDTRTKMTFLVEAKGFGVKFFGKLFAKIYDKNLDNAIPNLVVEMHTRYRKAHAR